MKRRTELARKRHRHKKAGVKPRGSSLYARKKTWLRSNRVEMADGNVELWGFNIPEPKPWK